MGRLAMRPCELVIVSLLGLLPTHAQVRHSQPSVPQPIGLPAFINLSPVTPEVFRSAPQLPTGCCSRSQGIKAVGALGLRGSGHEKPFEPNGFGQNQPVPELENSKVAMPKKKILITGGAGYIGSHLAADLLERHDEYEVVVVDNFSNSSPRSIERVQQLMGKKITIHEADTRNVSAMRKVFDSEVTISSVVHLAGLKAVGESVEHPNLYYENNVMGTITLSKVMAEYGCKKMVFSSSATVYGDARSCPIQETHPLSATSPYGRTKLITEGMLNDYCNADEDWGVVTLRYFNPVGAHPLGMLGEDPKGIPNNLMPYITKVALGKEPHLKVFGNDYPTPDGTGVRDYLHIMDLSRGHIAAIDMLENKGFRGSEVYNLGTGNGISVLEMVDEFRKASEQEVRYVIEDRRPGDVATCYADPSKAEKEMGWKAERSLTDMCTDLWRSDLELQPAYSRVLSTNTWMRDLNRLREEKISEIANIKPQSLPPALHQPLSSNPEPENGTRWTELNPEGYSTDFRLALKALEAKMDLRPERWFLKR